MSLQAAENRQYVSTKEIGDDGSRLLLAHRQGDITAFAKLEMLYAADALGCATGILKDAHLAEDIVQEAWLRVLRSEYFDPTRSLRAYLLTTVANLCRDHFRRMKSRVREVSSSTWKEDEDSLELFADPATVVRSSRWDNATELLSIIDGMDSKVRSLFERRANGETFGEIAKDADCGEQTLKSRYYHAQRNARLSAMRRGIHVQCEAQTGAQLWDSQGI